MDRQFNDLTQNFKPIMIHQEEEPVVDDLNNNSLNIKKDLEFLDKSFIKSANDIKNLLDNTKLKLQDIKNHLIAEKERQEDMNILCNRYTDFMSTISLKGIDFNGDLAFEDDILSAKIKSKEKITYDIIDIAGNGYEGNSYVYSKNDFVEKTIDSSKREAINDNNLATYYEYSRITVGQTIDGAPATFNKDSTEVDCSIEIKADKPINKILINSDRDDIILSKVFTSNDGLIYELDKEYNIAMDERYERYNNPNYIYGSGIIAINPAKYIKLFFKSNGYSNETIAFINTFYNTSGDNSTIIKKIEKVESAKRHIVRISDIGLFKNKYDKGYIISKELITDPIDTIALYCNEYINGNYTIENNVSYFLILNGVEYKVEPINSNRNGKKIVRMSALYNADHVIYLNENIKSARLKIVINSVNQDVTPYISDIKILIGGNKNE